MNSVLEKIEKYILYVVVFLLPITFITISPNPYVVSKLAVLTFGVLLILFVKAIRTIISGRLEVNIGTFDFPVFLLALSYILSSLLKTPNKMEAFLLPGTATAIIMGAFIYFAVNQLKERDKKSLSYVLFSSGGVFSIIVLLSVFGILSNITLLPAFVRAQGFTPEGGFLPAAIFTASLLPIGIGLLLSEKQKVIKLFLGITTAIMVFALVTSVIKILPSQSLSPQFPSFNVSWTISVDALKNSPLLGVGPGNYLTAFNMFKPLSYNTSNLWAVKFATANNFYLTLLTEAGLLAFAAIIFLFISIYKTVRRELKEQKLVNWGFAPISNLAALCVLILAMLFFPATILTLVVFYLYLSLSTKSKPTTLNLTTQGVQDQTSKATTSRFPALLIGIPVIVAVGFIGFKSANILIAEQKFTSALDMLVANDALKTYETLREAIRINPYVDRYHTTFARVNLALANSIAQKASENAAEDAQISDADRQNIAVLIQQAISEGKSAVALNQSRSGNWETLAGIYRTIIPLTKGADNFALQSYRQAITLDPFNPNLRIFLGGIYYSQKDYDNAIKMFDSAVAAKTDHANAHYNLAFALRDNNNLDRAVQELTLVLSLIPDKNSQDYQVAKTALDNIEAKIKTEAEPGEELTPPQGEESSEIQPPIELPEGSEPPEISVTPTPTGNQVSPTPTVSVTPTPTS